MIQPRLGHALITETMDTYGHLFPGSEDLGRGAVEAALRDALAEQEGSVSAKMQLWGAEDKDHALAESAAPWIYCWRSARTSQRRRRTASISR